MKKLKMALVVAATGALFVGAADARIVSQDYLHDMMENMAAHAGPGLPEQMGVDGIMAVVDVDGQYRRADQMVPTAFDPITGVPLIESMRPLTVGYLQAHMRAVIGMMFDNVGVNLDHFNDIFGGKPAECRDPQFGGCLLQASAGALPGEYVYTWTPIVIPALPTGP